MNKGSLPGIVTPTGCYARAGPNPIVDPYDQALRVAKGRARTEVEKTLGGAVSSEVARLGVMG